MSQTEKQFESDIEAYMLDNGFEKGEPSEYDRERAIDMKRFLSFLDVTQPKEMRKYRMVYGEDTEDKLYRRLSDSIHTHGILHVLRNGIHDRGIHLNIAAFKPESGRNEEVIKDYESNILTCTRQFKYSTMNENSIDMVLSLNGIPIIAIELKNQYTGQNVDNAKVQFMEDRDPRELCFRERFLAYFAVDHNEAWMTTKLAGNDTFFLPYNQGSGGAGNTGGAGNPPNPDGYPTSYIWEHVLAKDTLMTIIQSYMEQINGKTIFPRFHQLDVVSKLVDATLEDGAGQNYLIMHSAGSGKSNSICWLAYQLASLHDKGDNAVYDSVIIVTHRRVLDKQLRENLRAFNQTEGYLEVIDENNRSRGLLDAINDKKRVIVTTLQKFSVIYKDVNSTAGRRFAVIVDEAHSSQSGKAAQNMKIALTDTEEALHQYEEYEGSIVEKDDQDILIDDLITQGRQENISFYTFTATPKPQTLEMFGTRHSDGTFWPFHTYSMRQAIEEGFILDVLKNYTTYKTCFEIVSSILDNPELPKSKASAAIMRYESLHPYNLQIKAKIIVETFRETVRPKICGRGKAMIVTSSRLHAVRYYQEIKQYIEQNSYDDLEILVAFSGELSDPKDPDIVYTEEKMNHRKDGSSILEKQLPDEFHDEDYTMLVVANKYQEGYDEPLLCGMYVDKKLDGIKAVQTLNRLNRTYPGKTDTFILDFVNKKEDIQNAFKPFYDVKYLDQEINVNLIYDTQQKLYEADIYDASAIKAYYDILKKGKLTPAERGKLSSILTAVVQRFNVLDQKDRFAFTKNLRDFNRWYSYVIQVTRLFDESLQKEYYFTTALESFLPNIKIGDVDLEDKIKLNYFKLEKEFEGSLSLAETPVAYSIEESNQRLREIGKMNDDEEMLETIIRDINERYFGEFSESDRVIVETIMKRCIQESGNLERQAKTSNENVFGELIFGDIFDKVAQSCYKESMSAFTKLFKNKQFYDAVKQGVTKETYHSLRRRDHNKSARL